MNGDLRLVGWQTVYEQRGFWRNRQRAFFTFLFPLTFLVIFGFLYNGQHINFGHGHVISYETFFVPGILAYGVISSSYLNMASQTAILRDEGILKRMQGTPLPVGVYTASRMLSAAVNVALMTVVTLVFGALFFSVSVPGKALPAICVTLVVATAALTTLGIGITSIIKNGEAAPVVVNLTVLPLTFISGVWFNDTKLPKGVHAVAEIFPIKPLADGLQRAINPFTTGLGFNGKDLLTLAIWAVVGVFLMRRALSSPEGDRR